MNTVCAYFYSNWMSGRGCFVNKANPRTTDLNISIRSENFRFLWDKRSNTLNMTVFMYFYIGFYRYRLCRRSGLVLPLLRRRLFMLVSRGSRICGRRIFWGVGGSGGIMILLGGVILFFF